MQREVERHTEARGCSSGTERWQNGWSHIFMWWIKMGRDTSEARDLSPKTDHPAAQGSNTRKIIPQNFWL